VLPFARRYVGDALATVLAEAVLRDGDRTDNGNIVFDCRIRPDTDWYRLATWLGTVPGVVGHGLFLSEVDAAYIADAGVVTRLERRLLSE